VLVVNSLPRTDTCTSICTHSSLHFYFQIRLLEPWY